MKLLKEETLATLIAAHAIREFLIVRCEGGYAIQARMGRERFQLRSRRESVRRFRKLDTAAEFLRTRGVLQVSLDLA
ncbi:hypothetical protein [Motiliproteus sediminis]|uniref:hypothetical protein n=1 Tax=Motiliproteus sediminis TaxID=1468178 RepID=UPI001AEF6161|nr:hypothetical protein [Motiliproteus sediminis]